MWGANALALNWPLDGEEENEGAAADARYEALPPPLPLLLSDP